MKQAPADTLEDALDAAADLILANPPPPPPAPSIGKVCKEVGIGASTFYQLFEDVLDFRRSLVIYDILESYESGRQAVAATLRTETDGSANSDTEIASSRSTRLEHEPTTEVERARVMTVLSQVFQDTDVRRGTLAADYLPWLHVPDVLLALGQCYETASTEYGGIAENYLRWAGHEPIATTTPTDAMRRIIALVLANDLIPTSCVWATAADDSVPTIVYSHVNLVEALIKPDT